ncbi:MAG: septum formation initiator family protein [Firmicutes bacterium]|nr:septum formation initiator family protein [Bacillota bacterium]
MKALKSFVFSRGFKLILVLLLIFTGYSFYTNYKEIKDIEFTIKEMEEKIEMASQKNLELKEELAYLNDPSYIEEIARKELGLVKPGELLIIPVEEKE